MWWNHLPQRQKTKARFSGLFQHPAWKRRGPILISALHKFVTYLLAALDLQGAGVLLSNHPAAVFRVVSSKSSGNFPRKISGNLFLSFRKFLKEFFPMSISYFQVQWCCKISMFLTNNSPSFCFNFMHYVQKKLLVFMTVPRISAKSNENMDIITSQALANISGNFWKYEISRKFTTLASILK